MKAKYILFVFVVMFMFLSSFLIQGQTKVIAHRGHWKYEGSAQNSIRSLEMANQIKVYGSECDIWITTDNKMIITHDKTIGPDKLLISESSYEQLKNIKLPNGEKLSTLDDYLMKGKNCKNTKMILELKTHPSKEKSLLLAKQVVDKVKEYKMKKRVEYIAFSLDIAKELIRLDPKAKVHYLNGELSPKELKKMGFSGLDYHINVMKKNENWFKEAHDLGLKVNVWTVDDHETMQYLIDKKADFITTNEPEILQAILKEQ